MSGSEIQKILGLSRQRVYQLSYQDDFPAPAAVLACGRIWWTSDIEEYKKTYRPEDDDEL
ncbi:DNA-binding protein [Symbioplanes lichenis]|uniref:DNA-binding protein n=1 Tax=Symbioplanes lichenis TaxID=1629072 RepID=UPI0027399CD0|nr:DNA-binding protein [Actinoplanes lichenis]